MANLQESQTYEAGVYQLETTDPVVAGPEGISNLQAKQLVNRTAWLKQQVDTLLSNLDALGIVDIPGLQSVLDSKAPIVSPNLTGAPSAPTPEQFDASTKLMTTAFAQLRGFQFGDFAAISSNRSATTADAGKILWFSGAYTLTLPTPQSIGIPVGATITVYGTSGTGIPGTVAAGSGVCFDNRGGTGASVSILDDYCIFMAASATQWTQFGTADLQKTASFTQSKSANGYQKLPGGLIIQWGLGLFSPVAGNVQTPYLPVAYPNAHLFALASNTSSTGAGGSSAPPSVGALPLNLAQVQVQQHTNIPYGTYYRYLSIGY